MRRMLGASRRSSRSRSRCRAPRGAEFLPGAELVSVSPERQEQARREHHCRRHLAGRAVRRLPDAAPATCSRGLPGPAGPVPRGAASSAATSRPARSSWWRSATCVDAVGRSSGAGRRTPRSAAMAAMSSSRLPIQLVPADVNTQLDVYVRDMEQPLDSPTAFELVSARDGGDAAGHLWRIADGVTGAQVTAESALSADGRKVVFGTQAPSDLPAADLATTPAGPALRARPRREHDHARDAQQDRRHAGRRRIVGHARGASALTARRWPGPVSNAGSCRHVCSPGRSRPPSTTCGGAWRTARRAPTRRITGAADVDDPGLPRVGADASIDQTTTGPVLRAARAARRTSTPQIIRQRPSLSADGTRVAFLGGRPAASEHGAGNQLDVFVTDMTPGLTRKAATIELTRESQSDVTGDIQPVKISADGNRIAFVSNRQRLRAPDPAAADAAAGQRRTSELYVVYLDRMEIERVTHRLGRRRHRRRRVATSLGSIAISGDGRRVAFTSIATNLFPGDANEAADAFVASEAGRWRRCVRPARATVRRLHAPRGRRPERRPGAAGEPQPRSGRQRPREGQGAAGRTLGADRARARAEPAAVRGCGRSPRRASACAGPGS